MLRLSANDRGWKQGLSPFAGYPFHKTKSSSSSPLQGMLRYHVGKTMILKYFSE